MKHLVISTPAVSIEIAPRPTGRPCVSYMIDPALEYDASIGERVDLLCMEILDQAATGEPLEARHLARYRRRLKAIVASAGQSAVA